MISTRFGFSLFFFIIVSERMFFGNAQNTTVPVDVGVVLDMDTWNGKMGWSCINMALSDFYASYPDYKTRLRVNIRDSKRDVVGAAAAGSLSLSLRFSYHSEQQLT
jgi:ionotropic glutamate receptor